MAGIRSPIVRCCFRPALEVFSRKPRPALGVRASNVAVAQTRYFTASFKTAFASPTTQEQTEQEDFVVTRFAPASPSYFTGSAEFFDNWLALQELSRKYQTLPTVPADEVARVRWKTLQQYRDIVGTEVKSAKYKKIVNLLNRLNRIEPSMLPDDAKALLERYKRPEDPNIAKPKPETIDKWGRAWATGRRKTSVARIWLVEGTGEALVNGKPLVEAFPRIVDRESVIWPLYVTGRVDKYNIWALVEGGGSTGQAEALTLGVAKALMIHEPLLKPALRRGEFHRVEPRLCPFPHPFFTNS